MAKKAGTKKAVGNKKVLVVFIQDHSGSMTTCWTETVSGYRGFVRDLKENAEKDKVDYLLSLTVFDTRVVTNQAKPIVEVTGEEMAAVHPDGMTALYDAVGMTLESVERERHGAEKVICVIVTDGQENSSREWTKERLHTAIDGKLNAGDWTFTYLGTQPETWADAQALGVATGSTAGYKGAMAQQTYAAMGSAVRSLSTSDELQSRALFASQHADPVLMRAAKMEVRPGIPIDPTGPAGYPTGLMSVANVPVLPVKSFHGKTGKDLKRWK